MPKMGFESHDLTVRYKNFIHVIHFVNRFASILKLRILKKLCAYFHQFIFSGSGMWYMAHFEAKSLYN